MRILQTWQMLTDADDLLAVDFEQLQRDLLDLESMAASTWKSGGHQLNFDIYQGFCYLDWGFFISEKTVDSVTKSSCSTGPFLYLTSEKEAINKSNESNLYDN